MHSVHVEETILANLGQEDKCHNIIFLGKTWSYDPFPWKIGAKRATALCSTALVSSTLSTSQSCSWAAVIGILSCVLFTEDWISGIWILRYICIMCMPGALHGYLYKLCLCIFYLPQTPKLSYIMSRKSHYPLVGSADTNFLSELWCHSNVLRLNFPICKLRVGIKSTFFEISWSLLSQQLGFLVSVFLNQFEKH